ncbi:MAG: helix-turn-helix domain-containing protein, partial [Eubacteriales bacterium]|nr:helix-turn-helix domain-containing protein [Eubacteriales bacterium]
METYVTGSTIKRLREKAGLTQAALADILGVSDKAVSKWETGRGYPDITMLEGLAKSLRVSVTELLSGEEIINRNVSANMKKSKFYVCPVCGNVIIGTGEAGISCCGIQLPPLEAEGEDSEHEIVQERVEDETFITIKHEMTKEHYISFVAYVTDDSFQLVKFYPEGNAEARFKIRAFGKLY